jgi:putative transposase
MNLHWTKTNDEAKIEIEAWRRDYSESRPHTALGNQIPQEDRLRTNTLMQAQENKSVENYLWKWIIAKRSIGI